MEKAFFKILIILFISTFLFIGFPALAQICPVDTICIENPLDSDSIEDLVDKIIDFIFLVAVALAPLMILIGAFYFITSAGDPAKIQTAKNIILYTVIGLAIIMLAKGIISAIKTILGTS